MLPLNLARFYFVNHMRPYFDREKSDGAEEQNQTDGNGGLEAFGEVMDFNTFYRRCCFQSRKTTGVANFIAWRSLIWHGVCWNDAHR